MTTETTEEVGIDEAAIDALVDEVEVKLKSAEKLIRESLIPWGLTGLSFYFVPTLGIVKNEQGEDGLSVTLKFSSDLFFEDLNKILEDLGQELSAQ